MSNNLYQAAQQWAHRPDDERFASLSEMYAAARGYATTAIEAQVPFDTLRVIHDDLSDNLMIVGRKGTPATLTNYAFGQVAKQVGAPGAYLQKLPARIAAQALSHGLTERGRERGNAASLMFHKAQDGQPMVLRSSMTERYERIWNYEVIERLLGLQAEGWQVPPGRPCHGNQAGARPATADDVLRGPSFALSIKEGDMIAPSGLYASDHDMFAFMVYNDNRIDDGSAEGLGRGVIFTNSEVGDRALTRTTFLYRMVCGNHIIWDASEVNKISIVHTGKARGKMGLLSATLTEYANEGAREIEQRIKRLRTREIAATKQEVLDSLFRLPVGAALGQRRLKEAYELTELQPMAGDGSPRTAWGMVQGLTRLSQAQTFGENRAALDRAAGKLLQIEF